MPPPPFDRKISTQVGPRQTTGPSANLMPGPPPLFFPDKVVVTFRPGPGLLPPAGAGAQKFFQILLQLHQSYRLLSVQPMIRAGFAVLKNLPQWLNPLLEVGRAISFRRDGGGVTPLPAPAAFSPERLRTVTESLLLTFQDASEANLTAIINSLLTLNELVESVERVPFRYIQIPEAYDQKQPWPPDPEPAPGPSPIGPDGPGGLSGMILMGVSTVDPDVYWGMSMMGWDVGPTSGPVTVAMLDTGVDTNHPLLRDGQVMTGFTDANRDDQGHGTHVCGLLVGKADGTRGFPGGLLPARSGVISYKVVADEIWNGLYYPVEPTWVASALDDIVETNKQGTRISAVNLSIGGAAPLSENEKKAYGRAKSVCPLVASAGNHASKILYPAASDFALAVAAGQKTATGRLIVWKGSSPGNKVLQKADSIDYLAPGYNIYSTHLNGTMKWMEGTSMATPYITAMLALKRVPARFLMPKPDRKEEYRGQGLATFSK